MIGSLRLSSLCPRLKSAVRTFVFAGCAMLPLIDPPSARAQSSTIAPASPDGVAGALVKQVGLEGRVIWLDGTANLERLSTREGVAAVLDRCVRARLNTVVVDVKPLSGHVLYNSRVAPRLTEWRGFRYPAGYDLLRTVLDEGRRRGLKVHANINVFSDGHKLVGSGPIYQKPDEQSVIYDVERTFTTPRGARRTLAVGVNRGPEPGQVAVYDQGYRVPRALLPDEAAAVVVQERVVALTLGPLAPVSGIMTGPDRYLLVGRGEGREWLLKNVQVGDTLAWSAADRLIPVTQAPSETVAAFMNPANPVSREYLLKIVEELVTNYELDGIVFDRMRYASLHSDFSDYSRQKFEEHIGHRLTRFPGEIFTFDPSPSRGLVPGPFYRQWLEWRARNIRTWLEAAVKIVREKRPEAKIGAYVGSWYQSYYRVGVNWGSEEFMPGYDWMSPSYSTTGYAHLLDWITTGCYHPIATREQARNAGLDETYTVQSSAELSARAVADATFVYAGLYVLDYKGAPEGFRAAIRAARDYSDGVMLFDLTHLEEYGYWGIVEEELGGDRTAPHDVPAFLEAVRAVRKAVSAANRNSLP